jgi:hypothetical protein
VGPQPSSSETYGFCHYTGSKDTTILFNVAACAVKECNNKDLLELIPCPVKKASNYNKNKSGARQNLNY